ncbi:MAG: YcxB family protein [Waterburya sp.]
MDETIYIKYLWKTKDVVKGYNYHRKSSTLHRTLTIIYLIFGTYNLVFGLYRLIFTLNFSFLLSIAFGLFFLFYNRITVFFFVRNFEKLNYENKQVEWEISKTKIVSRIINLSESTFNWDFIQGILDTPTGFLLYPQKNLFHWLPKRGFANEEDIAHFVFIAQDRVKNFQQIK